MNEPTEIEAALAGLRPIEPELDRADLLYRAGYAAGRATATAGPLARAWQATAVVATAACLALAVRMPPAIDLPAEQPTYRSAWADWEVGDQKLAIPRRLAERPVALDSDLGPATAPLTARILLGQLLSKPTAAEEPGDEA